MVNAQLGLQRVSSVGWGFVGLLPAILLGASIFDASLSSRVGLAGIGIGGLAACYVAHRLTCWIVAGFFAQRS